MSRVCQGKRHITQRVDSDGEAGLQGVQSAGPAGSSCANCRRLSCSQAPRPEAEERISRPSPLRVTQSCRKRVFASQIGFYRDTAESLLVSLWKRLKRSKTCEGKLALLVSTQLPIVEEKNFSRVRAETKPRACVQKPTHIHTHVRTHTHTHTHTCARTHTRTHTHTTRASLHAHKHTHTHQLSHIFTHTQPKQNSAHTSTHTHTHTLTHTHTHSHTHTHTHTRFQDRSCPARSEPVTTQRSSIPRGRLPRSLSCECRSNAFIVRVFAGS